MPDTSKEAGGPGAAVLDAGLTLILDCPVCRSDAAETLGVAGGGNGHGAAAVVMSCQDCGTAYLTPLPNTDQDRTPRARQRTPTTRWLRRRVRNLAADGRVIRIDAPPDVPQDGGYDLVALDQVLERARDPAALLHSAVGLLSRGGRILVICANVRSSCFAVFGGRHWSGYAIAGARQQLTAEAVRRLCAGAGLRAERLRTRFAAKAWLESTRSWLRDWGAGSLLVSIVTGRWAVPAAIASLIEGIAVVRGRGALLVGELVRE